MNIAADHLRSLAMYITYAVEQAQHEELYLHNNNHLVGMGNGRSQDSNSQVDSGNASKADHTDSELSTNQLAVYLLELYAELLCTPGDSAPIIRFTKTVTNKVSAIPAKCYR